MLAERRAKRWAGHYRSSRGGDLYFVPWPKIVRSNFVTFQSLIQPHGTHGCSDDCMSFTVKVTEGSELLVPKQ